MLNSLRSFDTRCVARTEKIVHWIHQETGLTQWGLARITLLVLGVCSLSLGQIVERYFLNIPGIDDNRFWMFLIFSLGMVTVRDQSEFQPGDLNYKKNDPGYMLIRFVAYVLILLDSHLLFSWAAGHAEARDWLQIGQSLSFIAYSLLISCDPPPPRRIWHENRLPT